MNRGQQALPAIVTIVLGIVIAVQARINGALTVHVSTGLFPAWWTMTTGLIVLLPIVALHGPSRRAVTRVLPAVRSRALPWAALTGGLFGAAFLVTQSVLVPLVGVAVFSVGTVAGLAAGSLMVDRLGFSPFGVVAVTAQRIVAAVVAVVAVWIAISDRLTSSSNVVLFAALAFVAGALIAPQQAGNGRISVVSGSPFAAALVNSIGGVAVMSLVLTVSIATDRVDLVDPWGAPLWAYVTGVMGLAIIVGAAWAVPSLGVLVYSLMSVLGQLSGALLLDIVVPTSGTSVGWHLFAGVALTFVAVVIASRRRGRGRIGA